MAFIGIVALLFIVFTWGLTQHDKKNDYKNELREYKRNDSLEQKLDETVEELDKAREDQHFADSLYKVNDLLNEQLSSEITVLVEDTASLSKELRNKSDTVEKLKQDTVSKRIKINELSMKISIQDSIKEEREALRKRAEDLEDYVNKLEDTLSVIRDQLVFSPLINYVV